jgi:hypothetical protein
MTPGKINVITPSFNAVLYSAPPIPAGIRSFRWNSSGILQESSHSGGILVIPAVLYPPRVIPYGIHGMEGGIHGMSNGIHGLSRWIPYHFQVDSMEWQMDSISFPDGFHTISRVESIWNPCN